MQLKELPLQLTKSHDEQKVIEKERHENLTVVVDAQLKRIQELRATIERQAAELAKLKAPRTMESSAPTNSDALHRAGIIG
jgi:uncharacterized small protein (DUF1192 family)